MKRKQLLGLLAEYQPAREREQLFKHEMINFINAHATCFERTLEIGHITASAWLLNGSGTQALLMHHSKLDRWFQLGGHCDGESDVLSVALKEAREESGIEAIEPLSSAIFDIDIHLIPANSKEKEHYHYDVRFLLGVVGNVDVQQNSESKALRWFEKDKNALPTNSESVVRMFDKWMELGL